MCRHSTSFFGGVVMHIRWMIQADMDRVVQIESDSFTDPWTEDDFCRVRRSKTMIAMVGVHNDKVVSYVVYELRKRSVTIVNLATAADSRRNGFGEAMAKRVCSKVKWNRCRKFVRVFVEEGNLAGQLFFKSCGFMAVACGQANESGEDVYVMDYRCASDYVSDAVINRIAAYFV